MRLYRKEKKQNLRPDSEVNVDSVGSMNTLKMGVLLIVITKKIKNGSQINIIKEIEKDVKTLVKVAITWMIFGKY